MSDWADDLADELTLLGGAKAAPHIREHCVSRADAMQLMKDISDGVTVIFALRKELTALQAQLEDATDLPGKAVL